MMHPVPEPFWQRAVIWVALITSARVLALIWNQTDLFVDESQYWYWGQNLDFGYYSKPPLIGWVIRAVTELAGSDSAFWVRFPAALFHGATALILGALARRIMDARTGLWVAVTYATLPMSALGSLLISTDTIMAPFYAGALFFLFRLADEGRARDAVFVGLCAGAAFMAKYAAIYLVLGGAVSILLFAAFRPRPRHLALMAISFAAVIAPNVLWNLSHDFTTVSHTMDNVGWVRAGIEGSLSDAVEFFLSQFAVAGPIVFAALLVGFVRLKGWAMRVLAVFAVAPLIIVTLQAYLDNAYANWAVAAYFPGVILAVAIMTPLWRWISLGVNGSLSILLPVLTIVAPWPNVQGAPALDRYLGRTALSESILAVAEARNLPLVSDNRDILADLFYTGREGEVPIYAAPFEGRAPHYYAQHDPMPETIEEAIWVGTGPPPCESVEGIEDLSLIGTWEGRDVQAARILLPCTGL